MVRHAVSRGGQANQAGSLHRSGIAAYLAAHGLVGRGVEVAGYPESGPAPVTLAFETGDAVDDIRCGLADETALVLQAKRTCGADKHLKATVTQWAGQVAHLRPGDRLGLATAQPRSPVRELAAALDRRRRPVPGPFPPGEKKALAEVRARLPVGTPEQTAERVLDAATVMAVAASSPRDEGFRSVANLLDGTVVPVGSGSKAIAALQRAFQQQAAAGTGSGLAEWRQTLTDAGLDVIPDADRTAGQSRRTELEAAAAHRARLSLPALASTDSLLSFANASIATVGREGELGELHAFLATDVPFAWWVWTGSAGVGKSRLALDLCREVSQTWHAGFLREVDQSGVDGLQPLQPTLIVVDYAAQRSEWLSDALLRLSQRLSAPRYEC